MGDRTHAQPLDALGILLLLGIVKKNSILQVDYANTLRAQGLALHQAIVEASRTRLRPILMTTSAIIAGLIPTALGVGIGGEQRSAIALTIIGGQSLCLFLTLLLVPVAYVQLDRFETLIVSDGARAWLGRLSAMTLRRLKPANGSTGRVSAMTSSRPGSRATTIARRAVPGHAFGLAISAEEKAALIAFLRSL